MCEMQELFAQNGEEGDRVGLVGKGSQQHLEDEKLKETIISSCESTVAKLYFQRIHGIGAFKPPKVAVNEDDYLTRYNCFQYHHPSLEYVMDKSKQLEGCPLVVLPPMNKIVTKSGIRVPQFPEKTHQILSLIKDRDACNSLQLTNFYSESYCSDIGTPFYSQSQSYDPISLQPKADNNPLGSNLGMPIHSQSQTYDPFLLQTKTENVPQYPIIETPTYSHSQTYDPISSQSKDQSKPQSVYYSPDESESNTSSSSDDAEEQSNIKKQVHLKFKTMPEKQANLNYGFDNYSTGVYKSSASSISQPYYQTQLEPRTISRPFYEITQTNLHSGNNSTVCNSTVDPAKVTESSKIYEEKVKLFLDQTTLNRPVTHSYENEISNLKSKSRELIKHSCPKPRFGSPTRKIEGRSKDIISKPRSRSPTRKMRDRSKDNISKPRSRSPTRKLRDRSKGNISKPSSRSPTRKMRDRSKDNISKPRPRSPTRKMRDRSTENNSKLGSRSPTRKIRGTSKEKGNSSKFNSRRIGDRRDENSLKHSSRSPTKEMRDKRKYIISKPRSRSPSRKIRGRSKEKSPKPSSRSPSRKISGKSKESKINSRSQTPKSREHRRRHSRTRSKTPLTQSKTSSLNRNRSKSPKNKRRESKEKSRIPARIPALTGEEIEELEQKLITNLLPVISEIEQFKKLQDEDKELTDIKLKIQTGSKMFIGMFTLTFGILCRLRISGTRHQLEVIVPHDSEEKLVNTLHSAAHHMNREELYKFAQKYFNYKTSKEEFKDIKFKDILAKVFRQCEKCNDLRKTYKENTYEYPDQEQTDESNKKMIKPEQLPPAQKKKEESEMRSDHNIPNTETPKKKHSSQESITQDFLPSREEATIEASQFDDTNNPFNTDMILNTLEEVGNDASDLDRSEILAKAEKLAKLMNKVWMKRLDKLNSDKDIGTSCSKTVNLKQSIEVMHELLTFKEDTANDSDQLKPEIKPITNTDLTNTETKEISSSVSLEEIEQKKKKMEKIGKLMNKVWMKRVSTWYKDKEAIKESGKTELSQPNQKGLESTQSTMDSIANKTNQSSVEIKHDTVSVYQSIPTICYSYSGQPYAQFLPKNFPSYSGLEQPKTGAGIIDQAKKHKIDSLSKKHYEDKYQNRKGSRRSRSLSSDIKESIESHSGYPSKTAASLTNKRRPRKSSKSPAPSDRSRLKKRSKSPALVDRHRRRTRSPERGRHHRRTRSKSPLQTHRHRHRSRSKSLTLSDRHRDTKSPVLRDRRRLRTFSKSPVFIDRHRFRTRSRSPAIDKPHSRRYSKSPARELRNRHATRETNSTQFTAVHKSQFCTFLPKNFPSYSDVESKSGDESYLFKSKYKLVRAPQKSLHDQNAEQTIEVKDEFVDKNSAEDLEITLEKESSEQDLVKENTEIKESNETLIAGELETLLMKNLTPLLSVIEELKKLQDKDDGYLKIKTSIQTGTEMFASVYTLTSGLLCRIFPKEKKGQQLKVQVPYHVSQECISLLHNTIHDLSESQLFNFTEKYFHGFNPKTISLVLDSCQICNGGKEIKRSSNLSIDIQKNNDMENILLVILEPILCVRKNLEKLINLQERDSRYLKIKKTLCDGLGPMASVYRMLKNGLLCRIFCKETIGQQLKVVVPFQFSSEFISLLHLARHDMDHNELRHFIAKYFHGVDSDQIMAIFDSCQSCTATKMIESNKREEKNVNIGEESKQSDIQEIGNEKQSSYNAGEMEKNLINILTPFSFGIEQLIKIQEKDNRFLEIKNKIKAGNCALKSVYNVLESGLLCRIFLKEKLGQQLKVVVPHQFAQEFVSVLHIAAHDMGHSRLSEFTHKFFHELNPKTILTALKCCENCKVKNNPSQSTESNKTEQQNKNGEEEKQQSNMEEKNSKDQIENNADMENILITNLTPISCGIEQLIKVQEKDYRYLEIKNKIQAGNCALTAVYKVLKMGLLCRIFPKEKLGLQLKVLVPNQFAQEFVSVLHIAAHDMDHSRLSEFTHKFFHELNPKTILTVLKCCEKCEVKNNPSQSTESNKTEQKNKNEEEEKQQSNMEEKNSKDQIENNADMENILITNLTPISCGIEQLIKVQEKDYRYLEIKNKIQAGNCALTAVYKVLKMGLLCRIFPKEKLGLQLKVLVPNQFAQEFVSVLHIAAHDMDHSRLSEFTHKFFHELNRKTILTVLKCCEKCKVKNNPSQSIESNKTEQQNKNVEEEKQQSNMEEKNSKDQIENNADDMENILITNLTPISCGIEQLIKVQEKDYRYLEIKNKIQAGNCALTAVYKVLKLGLLCRTFPKEKLGLQLKVLVPNQFAQEFVSVLHIAAHDMDHSRLSEFTHKFFHELNPKTILTVLEFCEKCKVKNNPDQLTESNKMEQKNKNNRDKSKQCNIQDKDSKNQIKNNAGEKQKILIREESTQPNTQEKDSKSQIKNNSCEAEKILTSVESSQPNIQEKDSKNQIKNDAGEIEKMLIREESTQSNEEKDSKSQIESKAGEIDKMLIREASTQPNIQVEDSEKQIQNNACEMQRVLIKEKCKQPHIQEKELENHLIRDESKQPIIQEKDGEKQIQKNAGKMETIVIREESTQPNTQKKDSTSQIKNNSCEAEKILTSVESSQPNIQEKDSKNQIKNDAGEIEKMLIREESTQSNEEKDSKSQIESKAGEIDKMLIREASTQPNIQVEDSEKQIQNNACEMQKVLIRDKCKQPHILEEELENHLIREESKQPNIQEKDGEKQIQKNAGKMETILIREESTQPNIQEKDSKNQIKSNSVKINNQLDLSTSKLNKTEIIKHPKGNDADVKKESDAKSTEKVEVTNLEIRQVLYVPTTKVKFELKPAVPDLLNKKTHAPNTDSSKKSADEKCIHKNRLSDKTPSVENDSGIEENSDSAIKGQLKFDNFETRRVLYEPAEQVETESVDMKPVAESKIVETNLFNVVTEFSKSQDGKVILKNSTSEENQNNKNKIKVNVTAPDDNSLKQQSNQLDVKETDKIKDATHSKLSENQIKTSKIGVNNKQLEQEESNNLKILKENSVKQTKSENDKQLVPEKNATKQIAADIKTIHGKSMDQKLLGNKNKTPTMVESKKLIHEKEENEVSVENKTVNVTPTTNQGVAKQISSEGIDIGSDDSKNDKSEDEKIDLKTSQNKPMAQKSEPMKSVSKPLDFKSRVRNVQLSDISLQSLIADLESGKKGVNSLYLMKGSMLCQKCTVNGNTEIRIAVSKDKIDEICYIVHTMAPLHAPLDKALCLFEKYFIPTEGLSEIMVKTIKNCETCLPKV